MAPLPHRQPGAAWRLQTLGSVRVTSGDLVLERLPGPVAALLVRLALAPDTDHPREALCELLWPGAPLAAARNRLRNALSTLNRLLELPGLPGSTTVVADGRCLRLPAERLQCDAVEFESLLRAGRRAEALACWKGEFMPGHYGEWIEDERLRLQALRDGAPPAVEAAASAPPSPPAPTGAAWCQVPRHGDSFIGRDAEIAALSRHLAAHRLVWITGPAGAGKTRLAAEFGARAQSFDAVLWVPLLGCDDASHALEQVRAAIGLHAAPMLPLEQVAARLQGLATLMVLDNLEHLLGPGREAPFVAQLLARLPQLRIIATTQQLPRRPRGERLALLPLPLPPANGDDASAAAMASPALQLFVSRARLRRSDFSVHAGNRSDLCALCRALQGLPLAIELAATRVRELSPARMLQALSADERWPARKATGRHAAARHASLRNAIAWSWGRLAPAQQARLAALSVFRASFTPDDAAGVCGGTVLHNRRALQQLEALSMLQAQTTADGARWLMLDALRRHAAQGLDAATAAALRARHRRHFLGRAQALAAHQRHAPDDALADFVHAAETGLADGAPAESAAVLLALQAHWLARGTGARVLSLMHDVAQSPGLEAAQQATLHALRAPLLVETGRGQDAREAAAAAQRAAAAVRGPGAAAAQLDADLAAASTAWRADRDGAATLPLAQALAARADALGVPALRGRAHMLLGAVTWQHRHDTRAAEALFRSAQRAFEQAGDAQAALTALPGLTVCLLGRREGVDAAAEGAALARRMGHLQVELLLLNRVAEGCVRLRRHAQALAASQRLARLACRHGLSYHLGHALWNQAFPLARLGRAEEAALVLAFSARWWAEQIGPLQPEDERYVVRVRAAALQHLDNARWQALWARGQALPAAEGIALGCGADDATPAID